MVESAQLSQRIRSQPPLFTRCGPVNSRTLFFASVQHSWVCVFRLAGSRVEFIFEVLYEVTAWFWDSRSLQLIKYSRAIYRLFGHRTCFFINSDRPTVIHRPQPNAFCRRRIAYWCKISWDAFTAISIKRTWPMLSWAGRSWWRSAHRRPTVSGRPYGVENWRRSRRIVAQ